MEKKMKKISVVTLTILLSIAVAFSQATSGRLSGTVSGPDGALPNATVKVKDNSTGKELTAISNSEGSFIFPQLEFGTYTVTISVNGFKTYISNDVKIDVGRESSLSATLEIGSIQESVTITAGADVVNSTNAELSNTVSARQVQELPLNGRNPLALLNTIAGANRTSASINGQRSSSVNFTRDGVNIQDNFIRSGGFVQDRPSVDDTGEFTVTTQNAGAEQGGGGSTQVQLVTPRGGKEFHGAGFVFNRNAKFAANPFFNNLNGVARPFLNRNQFGGKIGGPVPLPNFGEGGSVFLKNKAFFFFSYEGFRLRQQTPIARNILLPEARNGTFTYTANDGSTRTVNVLNGTGLTGAISVLSVDPIIQSRLLAGMPTVANGNSTGINLVRTLNFNQSDNDDRERVTGRFDVEPNDRNNINFVYSYNINDDERQTDAGGFGTNPYVTQGGPTTLYSGAWSTVLRDNMTNEVRIGYQRSEPFFNQGLIASDFIIGGVPLAANTTATFRDQGRNTDFLTIQDNMTYTRGNHSFRFGGSFNAVKIQPINFGGAGVPTYTISTTANPNTPALLGGIFPGGIGATDLARANQLRYLLGGVIGTATLTANLVDVNTGYVLGAPSIVNLKFDNYSGYFSDQWRVSSKLTLNLGLRYEYFTPLRNPEQIYYEPTINGADPVASILNPNGTYQIVGGNAGKAGNFYKPDKNNFGPIFSFAYSPGFGEDSWLSKIFGSEGKAVIRGGFRTGFINDEQVQSANNAGGGNQGAGAVNITQGNLNATFASVPAFGAPPAFTPTRTYTQNNTATFNNFGTVFAIDPNLKIQQNYEYNIGYQREIGFNTAIEIRYVGGYSNSLVRALDFNQLDIRNNGFLNDFLRAKSNLALPGATTAFCNPAVVAGCQALTIFQNGGAVTPGKIVIGTGGFSSATFNTNLVNGVPADLAFNLITGNFDNNLLLPNSNTGVADLLGNYGKFRFNALQFEIRRRFTGGLSFQANYTFQKILTNVAADGQTRFDPYTDNLNPDLEYSRPDYDRTHTVNINGIYELPFGKGKRFLNEGGWLNRLVGGFQFNSLVNISSGEPTSIIDNRGVINRGGRSGRQAAGSNLTDSEIKALVGVFRTPNGVFLINPRSLFATATATGQPTISGFDLTQPLPAGYIISSIRGASAYGSAPFAGQVFFPLEPGQVGNLSRAFINGPIFVNWDASMIKNVAITETTRVQLRMEVFNVLNTTNFFIGENSGIFNVTGTNFGRMNNAYAPRIVQFAARFEF